MKDKKKPHKCENCPWGAWTGLKYVCMLPNCMPNLGDYK